MTLSDSDAADLGLIEVRLLGVDRGALLSGRDRLLDLLGPDPRAADLSALLDARKASSDAVLPRRDRLSSLSPFFEPRLDQALSGWLASALRDASTQLGAWGPGSMIARAEHRPGSPGALRHLAAPLPRLLFHARVEAAGPAPELFTAWVDRLVALGLEPLGDLGPLHKPWEASALSRVEALALRLRGQPGQPRPSARSARV